MISSVQLLSRVPTLCNPMDCSMPGLPVCHHLLALAQTHVHRISDALQPSHPPLSSPSSFPASGSLTVSQLFTSSGQGTRVLASASVLPMNIQNWFPLGLTGLISFQSKGLSRVFSNISLKAAILRRSAFFMVQLLTSIRDYWKNHSFDYTHLCRQSNVSAF